jgi:hypothetical protein
MMKCPLCSGELEDFDGELICTGKCGAAFSLEYLGAYEKPGSDDRRDEGFESKEWSEQWRAKITDWRRKQ